MQAYTLCPSDTPCSLSRGRTTSRNRSQHIYAYPWGQSRGRGKRNALQSLRPAARVGLAKGTSGKSSPGLSNARGHGCLPRGSVLSCTVQINQSQGENNTALVAKLIFMRLRGDRRPCHTCVGAQERVGILVTRKGGARGLLDRRPSRIREPERKKIGPKLRGIVTECRWREQFSEWEGLQVSD